MSNIIVSCFKTFLNDVYILMLDLDLFINNLIYMPRCWCPLFCTLMVSICSCQCRVRCLCRSLCFISFIFKI